jgi:hypothetical protein
MERKSKVTQATVNTACDQLQGDNKNVTVNAVIGITGGVFGKVCPFKADHDFILCTLGNKGELSQNLPINATEPFFLRCIKVMLYF